MNPTTIGIRVGRAAQEHGPVALHVGVDVAGEVIRRLSLVCRRLCPHRKRTLRRAGEGRIRKGASLQKLAVRYALTFLPGADVTSGRDGW